MQKNDVSHPSRKVRKGLATSGLVTLANILTILKPKPHNEMFISTCDIACGIDEPILTYNIKHFAINDWKRGKIKK
jgi:hypothetical protein